MDKVIFAPDLPALNARYDVIVDCVRPPMSAELSLPHLQAETYCPLLSYLEPNCNSRYVVLNPPLLAMTDKLGLPGGVGWSALSFLASSLASRSAAIRWAFFKPSGMRLRYLADWLAQGQIQVPIDSVFSFTETKAAFTKLDQRGNKGKIVVTVPWTLSSSYLWIYLLFNKQSFFQYCNILTSIFSQSLETSPIISDVSNRRRAFVADFEVKQTGLLLLLNVITTKIIETPCKLMQITSSSVILF